LWKLLYRIIQKLEANNKKTKKKQGGIKLTFIMLQKTANTKATSIRGQKYVPQSQKAAKVPRR